MMASNSFLFVIRELMIRKKKIGFLQALGADSLQKVF